MLQTSQFKPEALAIRRLEGFIIARDASVCQLLSIASDRATTSSSLAKATSDTANHRCLASASGASRKRACKRGDTQVLPGISCPTFQKIPTRFFEAELRKFCGTPNASHKSEFDAKNDLD